MPTDPTPPTGEEPRAALAWIAQQPCTMDAEGASDNTDCTETGACATEYCLSCYARAALRGEEPRAIGREAIVGALRRIRFDVAGPHQLARFNEDQVALIANHILAALPRPVVGREALWNATYDQFPEDWTTPFKNSMADRIANAIVDVVELARKQGAAAMGQAVVERDEVEQIIDRLLCKLIVVRPGAEHDADAERNQAAIKEATDAILAAMPTAGVEMMPVEQHNRLMEASLTAKDETIIEQADKIDGLDAVLVAARKVVEAMGRLSKYETDDIDAYLIDTIDALRAAVEGE